jgi:uncharacterized protein
MNPYQPAREASWGTSDRGDSRERFLVRTYNTLFVAILAFAGIEVGLFVSGLAPIVATALLSVPWLLVMGAFMVVGWLATRAAHNAESKVTQVAALGAYVVMQAIIFVPLLYIANSYAPGTISSAAMITVAGFAGLTGIAFWTRKDFSFLGGLIKWGGILALVAIVAGMIFGFQLGTFFSVAMIGLAGAAILYDTSSILREYPEDRYVGAALQLFASVALMFWYVLQLLMSLNKR